MQQLVFSCLILSENQEMHYYVPSRHADSIIMGGMS